MHKFNISLSVLTKKNFKILNIYLSLYALFNSLPIFIPYYSNKLFFNILYYSQFQNYNLFSPKNITSHSNKSSNLESIFLGNKSTNLTRRKFIINKTFNSYINIFFYTYIPNFNIHSSFINLYTTNSISEYYDKSLNGQLLKGFKILVDQYDRGDSIMAIVPSNLLFGKRGSFVNKIPPFTPVKVNMKIN